MTDLNMSLGKNGTSARPSREKLNLHTSEFFRMFQKASKAQRVFFLKKKHFTILIDKVLIISLICSLHYQFISPSFSPHLTLFETLPQSSH